MNFAAIVPVAQLLAVNAQLSAQGFGPSNFTVPAYGSTGATHGVLHSWDNDALRDSLAAIPAVTLSEGEDDPTTATQDLIEARGAKWGAQAEELPTQGNVIAGELYRYDETLWAVIQTFDRSTFGGHPNTYPALIRSVRDPRRPQAWRQPIDQYDSYKLVNQFTGNPDRCIHEGKEYETQVDNNVWAPAHGTLWRDVNYVAPPVNEWPEWVQPTGGHDAYKIGDKVTFNAKRYVSKINGNTWSPSAYPAGWTLQS